MNSAECLTSKADPLPTATSQSAVAVLVVDDSPAKRIAIKSMLAPLGYCVVEAESGVAALRCVLARDFAVILLDVHMPIMDGFETAAAIRMRQQSEMTPIIFITAYATDEIVDTDRYAQGAVDFITAPVRPDEVRAKVSVFANLFLRAETLAAQAREVQASADQLLLLTEAAPIGIFQTDAENRYIYTNPRWAAITGMSSTAATGQHWDIIVDGEQRASLAAELAAQSVDETDFSHRFQIQVPGSDARVVLMSSTPIQDGDGGISGWVGTLADITKVAGAEAAMSDARDEANAASQLKSDFLANMSHEIRTPMNGVLGMADLLLETDLDVCQRDYALTVRNSGEALLTVVNDILDFSKIETGKLDIEDIDFSVRTTVRDVVDLLKLSAQSKGLDFEAVVERSVPAVVCGDPGRVRQVLTNLVGNAIKFTQAGRISVRVTAVEPVGSEILIRFEVSDTGIGIAPEKRHLIFDPFVQADTSTSRKYGGTGLGLAISGDLVALMGGTVGVDSQLSAGSTFWFTVCARTRGDETILNGGGRDPELAGVHALVVHGDAEQRRILSTHLTGWGMTVETAVSGRSAVKTLETRASVGQPFAVAVADPLMPGIDDMRSATAVGADPILTTRLVLATDPHRWRDRGNGTKSDGARPVPTKFAGEALRGRLRLALGMQQTAGASTAVEARNLPGGPVLGRLLLAEDNLINQKVAVAMLSSAGYQIDTVLDGAQAVQAVKAAATRPYDAILMDCQMPEMDGYEATLAIRVHEGLRRHTPVIALTAGARREDRERCLAASMDDYLSKPIRKDVLLGMVRRWVKSQLNVPAVSEPPITAMGAAEPAR